MEAPAAHPTVSTLREYSLGKLDRNSAESVREHLTRCAACRDQVEEMSTDTFLDRLRDAHARPESPLPAESRPPGLWTSENRSDSISSLPPNSPPASLAEHPDYEILGELGRGGMGVVYLARNKLMERKEVLKVVSRELIDRQGVMDRFLREIRTAAQLHHPNIVTAHAAIRAGENIIFAMEYVEGFDLAQVVKRYGPLPIALACNFIYQTAAGLQYAHEHGTVHRDIKPSNLILARQGRRAVVKVLDFGLAKATREGPADTSLTHEGQMLGTPDYIAPEQSLDAQKADIRADIYSLGCTIYFLLTGRPPFQGSSAYEVLQGHHTAQARSLNLVRPDVPRELAAIVAKMMARDPERRYQAPAEVAAALKPFFKGGNVGGTSPILESPETVDTTGRPASAHPFMRATQPPTTVPSLSAQPQIERRPSEQRGSSDAGTEKQALLEPKSRPRARIAWYWLAAVGALAAASATMWIVAMLNANAMNGFLVIRGLPENSVVEIDGERVPISWTMRDRVRLPIRAGKHVLVVRNDHQVLLAENATLAAGKEFEVAIPITKPVESPTPAASGATVASTLKARDQTQAKLAAAKAQLATVRKPERGRSGLGKLVDRAIHDGVKFLLSRQLPDGSWVEVEKAARSGMTSLAVLALLSAGEKPDSTPVRDALEFLRQVGPDQIKSTYAISLQTMVFAEANRDRDRARIADNAAWLEKAQIKAGDPVYWPGSWTYSDSKRGLSGDNSNSQYALQGLNAASEAGVTVNPEVWSLARRYWERSQKHDGSWSYTPDSAMSSASMTCAGLSSLILSGVHHQPDPESLKGAVIESCGKRNEYRGIQVGLDWLANVFQVTGNAGEGKLWQFYYLCGLERLGRLAGAKTVGTHDWYREGAIELVRLQDEQAGSWKGQFVEKEPVLATAFAVLFLAKGRAPVLINKLRHAPSKDWNNDPDDIRNLVGIVSRDWKTLLSWQVIDLTSAYVSDLLRAPLLFLNGHRAPQLNSEARTKIREYVQYGGLVFAEACCGRQEFDEGVRALIKEMFPEKDHELRLLPADHPIWKSKHVLDPTVHPLWGITRDGRTVVVYSPRDLSCHWNLARRDAANPAVIGAVKLGQNVVQYATGGELPPDKLSIP
jgi:serine/threonine protein kinase